MRLVRRIGRGLAAGVVTSAVGGVALIALEVVAARTRRYAHTEIGLGVRATFGSSGPVVRMVMLGDSSAVGVGVTRVEDTVGGYLAALLATTGRRVELSTVGVSGSRSTDLATQVARALLGGRPDVAVILVGTHDATHLGEAVRRLRDAGAEVVVGTCPDLGAARAIAPPLRQIVGWLGRRVAAAQAPAVAAVEGVPVDLAGRTGAVFRADEGTLCADGFHPSADGYRVWAHALYPAVYEASRAIAT